MKMEQEKKKKAVILVAGSLIIYIVFRYLLPYVLPFFCAYFIAKLLEPCVDFFLKRCNMPKCIAAFIPLLLFVVIAGSAACVLGKVLLEQAGRFLRSFPAYQELFCEKVRWICHYCDGLMNVDRGTSWNNMYIRVANSVDKIQTQVMGSLTEGTWEAVKNAAGFFGTVGIMLIFTYMLLKDKEYYQNAYEKFIFYREIHMLGKPLSKAGLAYLKTQGILILLIGSVCAAGLYLIRSEYALLFGVGIAVFDAFPVLGSGLILVPWAVMRMLSRDLVGAIVLLVLYLLCQCIRQFLEPKLLGNGMGINPLMTLGAIYVGIRLFGILGVILGPVAVVILKTVWKEVGEVV